MLDLTKEELLKQHFKTVMHQINCRNLQKEEKSKMPPPKTIPQIITDHREERQKQAKCPYRSRLYKKDNPSKKSKRCRKSISSKYLKTDPAIIPLEEVTPQADPRSEPIMSWLDLAEEDPVLPVPTEQDTPTPATPESLQVDGFTRELIELFEIPVEEIPKTESSKELSVDLPQLDLNDELLQVEETLNFLDYLTENNQI